MARASGPAPERKEIDISRPTLFCYDGSAGAQAALAAAADLVTHAAPAVVLTVWRPALIRLLSAGGFAAAGLNEAELDEQEAAEAQRIADERAAAARSRGVDASPRALKAADSVARAIEEVAVEIDAKLIVCGRRDRSALRNAVLGSVSDALTAHGRTPVLVVPEPEQPA